MTLRLRPDGILDPDGRYPNPFTGEPYSPTYKEEAYKIDDNGVNKGWAGLKTFVDRFEIFRMMHNYQFILLIATTGVGKTVVVPKLMAHYFNYEKPIICTTPRQATTKDAGYFAAKCMDVPLEWKDPVTGETKTRTKDFYVGLRYGDEKEKDDKATKILFATDGTIKSMMMRTNPNLDGYYGILIDEAHERSVNIDILLGLIVDLCKRRPEFRVIIMSATVDKAIFIEYFNRLNMKSKFVIYNPEGVKTTFNLDVIYSPKPVTPLKVVEAVQTKIDAILQDNVEMEKLMGPGNKSNTGRFFKYGRDILGFVTSANECMKIKQFIDRNWSEGKYKYHPYTIVLTRDTEKWLADIAKAKNGLSLIPPDGQKYDLKVIISTPVAESSTTFGEPLSWVIDGGLANYVWFDPVNYGTRQFKDITAKANITQRCGRTGRVNDGICYKVYSEQQWNGLVGFPDPEIMHSDITEQLLSLILLPHIRSINPLLEFMGNMIEPPQNYKDVLKVGLRNLLDYDFVDIYGDPTPLGSLCASFGTAGCYIARLLIMGYYCGILKEVLFLGAILQNVTNYTDMFYAPKGKEEDQELKEQFTKILGEFTHPAGDHLTLVNLYLQWVEQPEYVKPYWEKQYAINRGKMNAITESIKELAQTVLSNIKEIQDLELIKIYSDEIVQSGGDNLLGSGRLGAFPTNLQGDKYIPLPGSDEFNEMVRDVKKSCQTQIGGSNWGPVDTDLDTRIQLNTREHDLGAKLGCVNAATGRLAFKQCVNMLRSNCPMIGGADIGKGIKKKQDRETFKKAKAVQDYKEKILKEYINNPKMNLRGLFTNGRVDLGNVYKLSLAERIMLSLYFAYHTRLGIYDGDDTKASNGYYLKYSPIKGAIKGSSLAETLKIRPNFILYHAFGISDMGNNLSIASHMPEKILKIFMNLKEKKENISF